MIILSATTDSLQAVLTTARTTNDMQCLVSYRDITTETYLPGRSVATTNGTTAVSIVPAPASSTQRAVDFISIHNADTVVKTISISFVHSGGSITLWRGVLNPGERLEYTDKNGWAAYTVNGSVKTSQTAGTVNPVSTAINVVVLASDVINNNVTANSIASVTGLSFNVTAGRTYWFEFIIDYTSAATTTGSRWSISGPGITRLAYTSEYSLTATTKTLNNLNAYDLPAASNATSAATVGNIATIWGMITPSENGTVIARFASEITNSAITAKAGSILRWMEVL
jgi:hypothetical protein